LRSLLKFFQKFKISWHILNKLLGDLMCHIVAYAWQIDSEAVAQAQALKITRSATAGEIITTSIFDSGMKTTYLNVALVNGKTLLPRLPFLIYAAASRRYKERRQHKRKVRGTYIHLHRCLSATFGRSHCQENILRE
jgi:hypothetical protein